MIPRKNRPNEDHEHSLWRRSRPFGLYGFTIVLSLVAAMVWSFDQRLSHGDARHVPLANIYWKAMLYIFGTERHKRPIWLVLDLLLGENNNG